MAFAASLTNPLMTRTGTKLLGSGPAACAGRPALAAAASRGAPGRSPTRIRAPAEEASEDRAPRPMPEGRAFVFSSLAGVESLVANTVLGGSKLGGAKSFAAVPAAIGTGHKLEAAGHLCLGALGMMFGAGSLLMGGGHVAWAIELEDGRFLAGENMPQGRRRFHAPNERVLLHAFEQRGMPGCKVRYVASPDPARAQEVAGALASEPYELLGHNCMDETDRVLRAYGWPLLPRPELALLASLWFLLVLGSRPRG